MRNILNRERSYGTIDAPVPNPRPDRRSLSTDNIETNLEWLPGLWILTTTTYRSERHPEATWTVTEYQRYGSYGSVSDSREGTSALHHALRPLGDDDPIEYRVNAELLKVFGLGTLAAARKEMLEHLYEALGAGAVEHLAKQVFAKWEAEEE